MDDDGRVTVFCVNRDLTEDCLLDLDLRSFGSMEMEEHIVLHHDDVKAVNTEDCPDRVAPVTVQPAVADNGRVQVRLPALSWNVLRFRPVK